MRVALIKGGRSLERAVSLRSGARVEDALVGLGHELIGLDADEELVRALKAAQPEVAFIALHGPGGEHGTVRELLEILRIPPDPASRASPRPAALSRRPVGPTHCPEAGPPRPRCPPRP